MKEFSIYLKGRPLDLIIPIDNLKFKDVVSLTHGITVKDYVTGIHKKAAESASDRIWILSSIGTGKMISAIGISYKIGILSTIGTGKMVSFVGITAPIEILTTGRDTKRSAASAGETGLELVSVINLHKVLSERANEEIGIAGGRYRLLNEHDGNFLNEMDDETLHTLDLFDALIIHEIDHESANQSSIISCKGAVRGEVCAMPEEWKMELRGAGSAASAVSAGQDGENKVGIASEVSEPHRVLSERANGEIGIIGGRYHLLNEHDGNSLNEMADETLQTLNLFGALIIHEIDHESADQSAIISCEGVARGEVYVMPEECKMEFQDTVGNVYMARYRILSEANNSMLADMDNMTIDDINYITF